MPQIEDTRAVLVRIEIKAVDCCSCGVIFGMSEDLIQARRKDGGTFYCPNGHSMVYTNSTFDRLKARASRAEDRAAQLDQSNSRLKAEVDRLSNDLMDKAKADKKLERRIHAGVCPYCHRTFQQLARHMDSKHPEKPKG